MSALPPDEIRVMRELADDGAVLGTAAPDCDDDALAYRWRTIHARATRIAALAALSGEPYAGAIARFPDAIAEADPRRRELADRAVHDLGALLLSGMKALDALAAREQDCCAPALSLWREYYQLREAILRMAEPVPA
ncbi:hypothetical protein [Erythrobacter sp.]|jgi:hypothetical protein|uniref:hypothetical protein n=1 Tax=Erythrobacter sp. TaxID=1042 RepID=UPI002EBB44B5|nr:hypothetical protein [Erythrobacter sp.]